MADVDLLRATTIESALTALEGGATPYAGGTELLAAMRIGLLQPTALVDLKAVEELGHFSSNEGRIRLGATMTHYDVASREEIGVHAGPLHTAVTSLGNIRVRATGTVAGNICFAEPRSDVLTALTALDAVVHLQSVNGARTVPVTDFVEGPFTTIRDEAELVISIDFDYMSRPWSYVRFQPAEYPTVAVSVTNLPDERWRVVVGAVGEKPQHFDHSSVAEIDAAGLAEQVDVMEDLNGAEDYKRHLTKVFIDRAVADIKK